MNDASTAMPLLSDALLPQAPLLVGYSGGLDSTVLLHALATGGAKAWGLRALHVHHGLHAKADDWARHCAGFCASLGIELAIARVDAGRKDGSGPEAAAREARYRAFAQQLREGEQLVLAHHRDDQAETVLLRLLRGSGSAGLAAMQARRDFHGHGLCRPLLDLPRARLLDYARQRGLSWIEDPSNEDESLDRNYLRRQVLPMLSQRWPQASTALAHSARWLHEDAALLDTEAARRLAQVQGLDACTLSASALGRLEPAWRSRVLRHWLAALGFAPPNAGACVLIESELLESRQDAEAEYRWSGCILRRWRDLLHVESESPGFPPDWQQAWNGRDALILPTGDSLRWQPDPTPVGAASAATAFPSDIASASARNDDHAPPFLVRSRLGGERLRLPGRQHRHALKKLLQEHGIPPWERERLPLLFASDGELLAAGDLILSECWLQYCREHGGRLRWQRGDAH